MGRGFFGFLCFSRLKDYKANMYKWVGRKNREFKKSNKVGVNVPDIEDECADIGGMGDEILVGEMSGGSGGPRGTGENDGGVGDDATANRRDSGGCGAIAY